MILPSGCLWTTLRDVEGFDYKTTLEELKKMYPPGEDDDMTDDVLPSSVPEAIRNMLGMKAPIEALGAMVWYLRQLNIDKDIMSMRNFNVYDPMKRGQGLVLDGQTLAHVEVRKLIHACLHISHPRYRSSSTATALRTELC
jgi:DNA mismatch repair protein MSH6